MSKIDRKLWYCDVATPQSCPRKWGKSTKRICEKTSFLFWFFLKLGRRAHHDRFFPQFSIILAQTSLRRQLFKVSNIRNGIHCISMRRKLEAPNLGWLKPLFFPNHIPTLTLTSLKYRFPNPDPDEKTKEVLKVASENLFERWTVCAEITFVSKIVSPMSVRRRLEALTDNSPKFRDHREHLSTSTITPTQTITLLKYPYPILT